MAALWFLLNGSICHQDSKIPISWIMYTHPPWKGHLPGGTTKDSRQINKTIQWCMGMHSERGLSYGQW